MNDGSGRTWREPFAVYDRDSCSWRTLQRSLLGDFPESPPTWPKSGTWELGAAYALPTSAHPTAGSASSSPPGLLPTPSASQFNDGESLESWEARNKRLRESWSSEKHPNGNGNGMGTPLPIAIMQLLKTPTAQLAVNGGSQHPDKRREGGHGPTLADQVECELLPTPRATDGTKGGPNQRGSPGDLMLPSAVMDLLPTPRATRGGSGTETMYSLGGERTDSGRPQGEVLLPTPRASERDSVNKTGARTSPEAAAKRGWALGEALTSPGEPTDQQSPAGKPSSDARHPGQLSLDGPESA
jgi:hypothetical protein